MASNSPPPVSSPSGSGGGRAAIEAELTVLTDSIERYRERIAGLASAQVVGARGTSAGRSVEHGAEDLVAAMHEAERALRSACRHLQRAVKLAR